MTDCREFEVLVSLRAAGALDREEAARLAPHLASCAACRAEVARTSEALWLAKLPPPTEAERRALRELPARTVAAFHRSEERRGAGKLALVGIAAAAALAAFVLAPALLRRAPALPETAEVAAAEAAPAWEEPDVDALFDDAELLDVDHAPTARRVRVENAALSAVNAF